MSLFRSPLLPGLIALVGALSLVSLAIGPAPIAVPAVLKALVSDQGAAGIVVREIRLPRTALAGLVGWILGLSGAGLQGLLRNPLADTAVFGAPQAAAFGAVLVIYSGLVGSLSWALPFAAIAGALLSVGLVVAVAGRGATIVVLVLAGLAVGSLAGAGTSLAISLSPNPFAVTEIVFWLLGSFEDRSMVHVLLAAPFIVLASGLILSAAPGLRALALGEETARSLGIGVPLLRALIVAGAAVGTGASVAVAGSIGFVGLVVPHLVRPFVSYDPARTLVPAGLAGAALLLAADIAVRLVPSAAEVKIGVLTALLGVPFFLWVIARRKADLVETPA
ncbi:FecCD family ABC transporter permease [Microvirga yunnanensis]|uniref:FecCD family ABC transporter permease n=1 Tax=Microvirga yunnanensis TaxID=2953740 RepID=UPI0021CA01FC|nr:iron ABC transporter permease [Microvirga sp. HBU65207]